MSDMIELMQGMKKVKQEERTNLRESSPKYLEEHKIPFETKNGGAHLIVEGKDCFIDFWPGTGKWITRHGERGFGVRNLVNFILGDNHA